MAHYLRLDERCDIIDWQLDETPDINGWDIQKALKLLYKSDSALFEWNSSPIVYRAAAEWKSVSAVTDRFFTSKKGVYRYLSTARGNYYEFLS